MTTKAVVQGAEAYRRGGISLTVVTVLGAWFLLVLMFGAAGAFVALPGKPPLAMAIGVAAPLLVFFAWLNLSQPFREFVLALDLRLIVGMQAWRWAGLGFLTLYAHKILPAVFALPAGLGDMAVGITAPWMMLALIRNPGFAASGAFIRWNLLGHIGPGHRDQYRNHERFICNGVRPLKSAPLRWQHCHCCSSRHTWCLFS